MNVGFRLVCMGLIILSLCVQSEAQNVSGTISGVVMDQQQAVMPGVAVAIRNIQTNAVRTTTTGDQGRFRVPGLPVGNYEVTVEHAGFGKHVRSGITLVLNQDAVLEIVLKPAEVTDVITVSADAPLLNTTNAEVGVNFDHKRITELPLSPNRNIINLALSVPGVSQQSPGQSAFANSGNTGTETNLSAFSVNGMRLRSNNFMIDGQDANGPSVGGFQLSINNPDIVAEFRLITNQFAPEYGRAAGAVVNIVTKTGSNKFHGTGFWFHNSNPLNSRSNLDKAAGFTKAPFRTENQFGGTIGGPILKDKTFFFGSLQRWTDRRLGAGSTINGAPTEAGRSILQQVAGDRPQVKALLDNLPAAQTGALTSRTFAVNGVTYDVPLGNITGSAAQKFDNWQYLIRLDHRLTEKHTLGGRYMKDDTALTGSGQATPAGLTNVEPYKRHAFNAFLNSALSNASFNELRAAFWRTVNSTNAENPAVAERIPSLEVTELGLRGFNAIASRTAIGLAVNLPQYATLNNYQLQNNFGLIRGSHSMKFGIDFRRQEQFQFFLPTLRGRLEYASLQRLVDDLATVAQINSPLRGAETITYLRYYDYFFFLQDEWRMHPDFTLTYGLRYESPGNFIDNLKFYNDRVVQFYNDERYRLTPAPGRDMNNWSPRVGFNYRLGKGPGALGWLTGDRKLVLRGGYSRTYDLVFNNIALNVASSFPFVQITDIPLNAQSLRPNAFTAISAIRTGGPPPIANPDLITRTIVSSDFRAPLAEQLALQFQRELSHNFALTIGYVGTKGTALFQTIDGNPTMPVAGAASTTRVNPTKGVIRERCNCTSSIYHSLQASLEKRLSNNFSMGAHYTWSAFIDGASEIFNPSNSGEIAIPQDSFDRHADRGRSSYDRPHRFSVNGLFELPWMREQNSAAGKILGGWQTSYFVTLQAGPPFSALNGSDPGGRVQGINGLVGTSIRPHLNTTLDISRMNIPELQAAGGGSLFRAASLASPLGNLGRNVMRADGINRLDFGISKNTKLSESHTLQFRADFFNVTNTRNFGIPEAVFNSPAFLNQWAGDGGNRRIQMGLRYIF
jgi:hypothetical protein